MIIWMWEEEKKQNKHTKNVYRLMCYWGNVVSYVIKDSWTKHNQFTTELCCIVTKIMKMRNKCKMKKTVSHRVLAIHMHFFWGSTAKAQKSLLGDQRITKSLPSQSVDSHSKAPVLQDWIEIPVELFQQSKEGSVTQRLSSLSTGKQ